VKITVPSIGTNEGSNFEKMKVKVSFERKVDNYNEAGEVFVMVDKSITDIETIRQVAIQNAIDFLEAVQDYHCKQNQIPTP